MLVFLGEILPKGKGGGASLFMSAGIVAAQLIMIGAALAVPPFSKRFGRKPIFLFAMAALIARGLLFAVAGKHRTCWSRFKRSTGWEPVSTT